MGVLKVLGLIFISVTLVQAGLFEAVDDTDYNVWENEERSSSSETDSFLRELCNNFHLVHQDELIDCTKITFYPKLVETDDFGHVISKRDADELEGSGDVPNILPNQTSDNDQIDQRPQAGEDQPKDKNVPVESVAAADNLQREDKDAVAGEDTNKKDTSAASPGDEKVPVEPVAAVDDHQTEDNKVVAEEDSIKKDAIGEDNKVPVEPKSVAAVDDLQNEPKEQDSIKKDTIIASPEDNKVPLEPESVAAVDDLQKEPKEAVLEQDNIKTDTRAASPEDKIVPVAEEAPVKTKLPSPVSSLGAVTQNFSVKAEETTVKVALQSNVTSVTSNVSSSDEAKNTTLPMALPPALSSSPADVSVNATTAKTASSQPKEAEPLDDKQSGNVNMFQEPNHKGNSTVELSDSDKHLDSLATNAKITNQTSAEQPKTSESSKDVQKAGKDTTILVVLFVVVIVIGAAAFTYNFLKKRRQKTENGDIVDGIRKSLQNLSTNAKNTDVEQGTEMKPLMKNGNNPVIVKEYSDRKSEEA